MEKIMEILQRYLGDTIAKFALALVVLLVGLVLIGWVMKLVKKSISKAKIDVTLKPFIVSLISVAIKIVLILGVLEIVGFKTTSLVAVLGAASLAIGLAFQGTLSNLAGGVLLLSLRPFNVGDYVEAAGHSGTVEAIHIFTTMLVTPDNKTILIPNGQLSGATLINYTSRATRRVDFSFGVSYDSDLKLVHKLIEEIVMANPMVHKEPVPFIRLGEQGSSSLNFTVRIWTDTANYWNVYFDTMTQVTNSFNENNISIPFPQMDVHMSK